MSNDDCAAASDYRVDICDSEGSLQVLISEWLTLWRASTHSTPFQSPYWNLAWWRHLKYGGALAVITLRHLGKLVGLAPWRLSNNCGRQVLSFIAAGVTDCLDMLWLPGYEARSVQIILREIEHQSYCDEYDFDELSADSPLINAAGFTAHATRGEVCPVLVLPGPDGLNGGISPAAIRRLGYYRRRLARNHKYQVLSANPENINYLLAELLRIHHELWSARGQAGVLCGKDIADFHREAATALLREGVLRMYLLRIDDCSAAVFYGFQWHQRTYYYLGGYAPEFEHLNPGTLVIGHAIDCAIREGSREFNFLRGRESYKYWWGARDRFNYRLRIPLTSIPAPVNGDDLNPRP